MIHVLSIEVMEGFIDEPNELFHIQKLKPRELDLNRVNQLKEKFVSWNTKINQTKETIANY